MASRRPVVAIVGGGYSGCMVAIHLLQNARQPLRIILIERNDAPGRGVAYRDQPECHLLNVRASAMSAFPDQPDHFLDWLNRHYSPCSPVGADDFVPRRIYGAYLEGLLVQAAADARSGVVLEARLGEVLDLRPRAAGGGYELRLAGGSRLQADACVLAIGNAGPADPQAQEGSFHASPRYQGNAWHSSGLYSLKSEDNVLLIGSGLTALDWLAALHARRHRGRIHVLSRRGLLPHVHKLVSPHKLGFVPTELPPKVLAILNAVRRECRRAEAAGGDWRAVIDALRPHTQDLWQSLPPAEQARFLRHARPYWEIHRHRGAPRIIEAIYELLRAGHLDIRAGRIVAAHEDAQGLNFEIRPRGSAETLSLNVQRAINCTGPDASDRRLNHPLLLAMSRHGLLQTDALGLGLRCDAQGALLGTDGRTATGLYTLGPPRKGQLWETTAVPDIRVQAQALARLVMGYLREGSRTASLNTQVN